LILIAVWVGRGRSGVLCLRDEGGYYESCCQCGSCKRILETTVFEETGGRHVFACLLGPSFVRQCIDRPDFAESKDEFQPGRFALVKRSID
jgi:hypothetical protein